MTALLDKVKTVIEYARFGMGLFQMFLRDDNKPGFLYFPQKFDIMTLQNTMSMRSNNYISSIKGRIIDFYAYGAMYHCENMAKLEEVDLPECVRFYGPYVFKGCTKLHTVKLPLITMLDATATFDGCTALKYLEVGEMTSMAINALLRCINLETIVVGENTRCNLYFKDCYLLTQECLHGIIDNVQDRTGKSALTLYVHQYAYDRISEEYKTKLFAKNWNLAVES